MPEQHFFFVRTMLGRWSPVLSETEPSSMTQDGKPIMFLGHVRLAPGEERLTLSQLTAIYPLGVA